MARSLQRLSENLGLISKTTHEELDAELLRLQQYIGA